MEFGAFSETGVEFRILGPVEVYDSRTGAQLVPSGAKQRILLATFVVRAGQVLGAERLIDELWGERPPVGAANALQAHVARLRRLLPDGPRSSAGHTPGNAPDNEWITTHALGYLLRPGRAATDAQRFHRLSAEGRAALADDPVHAAGLLRSALDLWRGPALAGSVRGSICAVEADRLEELRLTTLETLYEANLRSGRHAEIARELERLTAEHPLRERFYDLLMLSLYRCGRQSEALGAYERARRRLVDGLGVEPGPALRGRMEAILRHAPSLAVPRQAPGPGAGLLELGGEIARLRERIEKLTREQEALIHRFNLLDPATHLIPTAPAAPRAPGSLEIPADLEPFPGGLLF
ncbi:AfsR/SARP family transcriptional regulator [Streptomyces sp. H34-S4]|uniref:AfsR/SARP family transcriptional regulator n=1 Tax=Streptomyces sp. H34-S4 TaxID=2996463 RepID=UPI00226F6F45|nr:AfsR/SARP family transcriptional regulator [Streptomyces sp. H34-S4]MCY0935095.1 AfsR/SARP family transcriptional regulator [Streptomyces sp. H34-S4]